jgi:parvulin-like peptidyl-prolyl isomerase
MQNPLIIAAGIIALLGLILMLVLNPFGSAGITEPDSTANPQFSESLDPITVNGEAIPDIDIQFTTNAALQVFRELYSQLNIDFEEQLLGTAGEYEILQHRGDAARVLIEKRLLFQEIARQNLSVSDEEINSRYEQNLNSLVQVVFQTTIPDLRVILDDEFSRQQFQQVLFDFGVLQVETGTYAEFEQVVRTKAEDELLEELFRDQIVQGVQPSDSELFEFLGKNRGRYALLFISQVIPTEAELLNYFEANREQYSKASTLDDARDQVKNDFRVEAESEKFDAWLADAQSDGVFPDSEELRARHILIGLPPEPTQAEIDAARARLIQVQNELRSGTGFDELAQAFSEDTSTSPLGGDLGWFSHGMMVAEFDQAAYELQIGEVSDIVRTQFGLHLIELLEKRPTSSAKDSLTQELISELGVTLFSEWVATQIEVSQIVYNDPLIYAHSIEQLAEQANIQELKLGLFDEAIEAYEAAKSVSIVAPSIGYFQSQVAIKEIEYLEKEIELNSSPEEIAQLRIRIADLKRVASRRFLQGSYTGYDIPAFEQIFALDPGNPELIFAYAEFLLDERYDLIGALEQLLSLQQDFPNYNTNKVAQLLEQIELDEGLGPDGLPGRPVVLGGQSHINVGEIPSAYNSDPPTSGDHYPSLAPYGISEDPIPDAFQVHNLEHGAVIIQYAPSAPQELRDDLRLFVEEQRADPQYCRLMLAPRPGLDRPVALTAWGRLLKLDDFDLGLIVGFVETFLDQGPEQVNDCSIE